MKHLTYLLVFLVFVACNDNSTPEPTATVMPEIVSLTADKMEIGIGETTELTCVAKGDQLVYEWLVALGDIIPVSEDNSVVQFSGAACCSGTQTIMCRVSNDVGSDEELIIITLFE